MDIFEACKDGNLAEVRRLLEVEDFDVNTTNSKGKTPLYTASCYGRNEIVAILLEKDADPNLATTNYNTTPLYIASQEGHNEIVSDLLAADADPNLAKTDDGATPLFVASYCSHFKIATLLLNAGADPIASLQVLSFVVVKNTRLSDQQRENCIAAIKFIIEHDQTILKFSNGQFNIGQLEDATDETKDLLDQFYNARDEDSLEKLWQTIEELAMDSDRNTAHIIDYLLQRATSKSSKDEVAAKLQPLRLEASDQQVIFTESLLTRVATTADLRLVKVLINHGANIDEKAMGQSIIQNTLDFVEASIQSTLDANQEAGSAADTQISQDIDSNQLIVEKFSPILKFLAASTTLEDASIERFQRLRELGLDFITEIPELRAAISEQELAILRQKLATLENNPDRNSSNEFIKDEAATKSVTSPSITARITIAGTVKDAMDLVKHKTASEPTNAPSTSSSSSATKSNGATGPAATSPATTPTSAIAAGSASTSAKASGR